MTISDVIAAKKKIKVIDILEQEKMVEAGSVKKSTLHRLFQQQRLTDRVPASKAYWQRYEAQFPNDLWQSDQMHGPEIVDPKNPERTIRAQLLAWIDDHSRVICHAQFYPHAQLGQLEHCLRKAIQKMGVPKMIYTDNGSIYLSGTPRSARGFFKQCVNELGLPTRYYVEDLIQQANFTSAAEAFGL